MQNGCVLAALFDKGEEGMIDGVLGRVEYDDDDLCYLTDYRPELAGSPEKFFRVLDKIKEPEMQESAVRWGVRNLFKAGRHDLVVPLVNALGKRTFKSKRLKEEAIQGHFMKELKEAIKTLWNYITNILRSLLRNMLMDCMDLGTMANQIKSFRFYWSKLTKETWIWPKRDMRMRTMQSSVKPLTKPSRLPHQQDQDIFA